METRIVSAAEWRRRAEVAEAALREIHTNVEPLAKGGPTVGPAAWYFQVVEAICRSALDALKLEAP